MSVRCNLDLSVFSIEMALLQLFVVLWCINDHPVTMGNKKKKTSMRNEIKCLVWLFFMIWKLLLCSCIRHLLEGLFSTCNVLSDGKTEKNRIFVRVIGNRLCLMLFSLKIHQNLYFQIQCFFGEFYRGFGKSRNLVT